MTSQEQETAMYDQPDDDFTFVTYERGEGWTPDARYQTGTGETVGFYLVMGALLLIAGGILTALVVQWVGFFQSGGAL